MGWCGADGFLIIKVFADRFTYAGALHLFDGRFIKDKNTTGWRIFWKALILLFS